MTKFKLKLFISGLTPRAQQTIENLWAICEKEYPEQYELQVIDVLEHPEMAEKERILATPTVIKELPLPLRRLIGDLSDSEKVLMGLDLLPQEKEWKKK